MQIIHSYFMWDPRDLQKHCKAVVSHTAHDDVSWLLFTCVLMNGFLAS